MSQVRAVAVSRLMPSALASVKIFDRHDRYEWHLRRRIRWWIRCPVRRCPFGGAAGSKISGSLTGRKIPRLASSFAGVLKRLSKTTLVSRKKVAMHLEQTRVRNNVKVLSNNQDAAQLSIEQPQASET